MNSVMAMVARLLLYGGATNAIGEVIVQALRDDQRQPTAWSARLDAIAAWRARSAWLMALVALLMLFVAQCVALELAPRMSDLSMLMRQTTWGFGWSILACIALIGAATAVLRAPFVVRAMIAVALAVAMGGLGHAAADDAMPVTARVLDAVHVLGMGAWIGMLLCVPSTFAPSEWARVSAVATVTAPLTVLTGLASALRRVWGASLTQIVESDYGKLLVLKLTVVAIVLALAMLNRRALKVRGAPTVTRVRAELLFACAVFVVTAVLTGTAPPGD